MCFPSWQAQPCWFPGTAQGFRAIPVFSEVFHPQHHGKPDLMVWPFWITKNTVCVKLLHCLSAAQPRQSFIPLPFDALPKHPTSSGTTKCHFPHIPEGGSWHVCTGEKEISSPQHTNPSLKQCKSSFSLRGSPLIFHTSANLGQGWTDLRKGLWVLWKSLWVQPCVCI